jgi:hypothetical protein
MKHESVKISNEHEHQVKKRVQENTNDSMLKMHAGEEGEKMTEGRAKLPAMAEQKKTSVETPTLKNKSKYPIYYRPEEGSASIRLNPGGEIYTAIDGIAAPHIKKECVYKVVDGVNAWVTDEELYDDGMLIQWWSGGWKDEAWLNELTANSIVTTTVTQNAMDQKNKETTQPKYADLKWINLFKDSGLADADKYREPHAIHRSSIALTPTGRQ